MTLGATRTRIQRRHALIAPDGFVWDGLPGWDGAEICTQISPAMGARFSQYLVRIADGMRSAPPGGGVERFFYVWDGSVHVEMGSFMGSAGPGWYGYVPPDTPHVITGGEPGRMVMIERAYVPLAGLDAPKPIVADSAERPSEPFMGNEDTPLTTLLPSGPAFDMAMNLFSFQPGATHPFVETHVMEHGLVMLEGQGIYRLDDDWYPTGAGDVIWMGPYCPQWFCAIGKSPATYLYYKDINRDWLAIGA